MGYLPHGLIFNSAVSATSDLKVLLNSDLIIIATPLNALRGMLMNIYSKFSKEIPDIIWVCKGFESDTGLLPHQIAKQVLGERTVNCGALLGPSFAFEVANGLPTAVTLATHNLEFGFKWIELFKQIPNFRVYVNADIIGAEIGAALKNIIAIAAGIADGLSLGQNARAALITRGLSELACLVVALGGNEKTIYGLTGVGDLILTCTGNLSRNRIVGQKLAMGLELTKIISELGHVAEGILTTKEVYKISLELKIEMPIIEAVFNIIYNRHDVNSTIIKLLNRLPKPE